MGRPPSVARFWAGGWFHSCGRIGCALECLSSCARSIPREAPGGEEGTENGSKGTCLCDMYLHVRSQAIAMGTTQHTGPTKAWRGSHPVSRTMTRDYVDQRSRYLILTSTYLPRVLGRYSDRGRIARQEVRSQSNCWLLLCPYRRGSCGPVTMKSWTVRSSTA